MIQVKPRIDLSDSNGDSSPIPEVHSRKEEHGQVIGAADTDLENLPLLDQEKLSQSELPDTAHPPYRALHEGVERLDDKFNIPGSTQNVISIKVIASSSVTSDTMATTLKEKGSVNITKVIEYPLDLPGAATTIQG